MNIQNHEQPCGRGRGIWAKSVKVCSNLACRLTRLREQLILNLAKEAKGLVSEALMRRALAEAEALAFSTRYPLLFLPALAEEKVLSAKQWTARQKEIIDRQRALGRIL